MSERLTSKDKIKQALHLIDHWLDFQTYKSDWGIGLVSRVGSKLIGIDPSAIQPAQFVYIYKQQHDLAFVSPKNMPFASPGEIRRFKIDEKGNQVLVDSHGGVERKIDIAY